VNPIPGPLLLLALPLLAAGATYLVRRWTSLAALLAAATTAILAFLCLRLPLDRSAFVIGQEVAFGRPIVVLSQSLQLNASGQHWLAFIFALVTILFLIAWRVSQGRSFFSFGLAILALYVLVVLLEVFVLAVLVFAISTALAVFIIQGGQLTSVRGAQRYLLVSLLAVPPLLAAAWLMDTEGADAARGALLPAALGFGLLLAAFPFGTWMPAVAADAPAMVAALVFTAGQAMALYLALVFLRDNPVLLVDPTTSAVIQLAGLVMTVSGGIMAAVQRDFGRFFGYAALSGLGVLLMAMAVGGSQSVTLTLLHATGRCVAITLMAAALAILRHRATTDRFDALSGWARRLPLTTAGLLLGGLALAGFPLTAGFPMHWAIYRAVSGEQWLLALLLVASSAGIVIGLLRGLAAMRGPEPRQDVARQPVVASLMVLALAALLF
jgi:formate hydrogenlyase subunit 3/multisubunit Na+/H+ antiporter MnhD subunit